MTSSEIDNGMEIIVISVPSESVVMIVVGIFIRFVFFWRPDLISMRNKTLGIELFL